VSGGPDFWTPEYDAVLVEEAVAFALRGKPQAPYWFARSRVYEIADEDARARKFLRLASEEFEAQGLGRPLDQALRERPVIAGATAGCLVAPAVTARDEGAELFVRRPRIGPEASRLVVRLRSSSFADPKRLLAFLRHELCHIADMVDPAFGYEPVIGDADATPGRDRLLVARYRALWDAAIDGRLVREGRADPSLREARRRDLASAFPGLEEEAFEEWLDGSAHTHPELVAFALGQVASRA
jgi:hypothetical protein